MKRAVCSIFACFVGISASQAGRISINLTNGDGPRQILASESTGVIDTTGWLNLTAGGNDVDGTVVDISLTGTIAVQNTARDKGSGDGTDGFLALFEAGLKDSTPSTAGDTYITVSDMAAYMSAEGHSSYRIIAYYKSAVTASPDGIALGLSTETLTSVNPIDRLVSVNDGFVESASPDSNYMVFSGLTADSASVYINRVNRDGILTGMQIETIPEPATLSMTVGAAAALLFIRRRMR
jgi:hypothetical protein